MIRWLRDKMDFLTEEFIKGAGYGVIYEAQYLVYLECLVAARGGDPNTVWTKLRELRQMETPEGEEVRGYSHVIEDRKELASALTEFRFRFDTPRAAKLAEQGPRKSNYSPTAAGAQPEPPTRSKGDMEAVLDLLGGEDP